MIASPSWSKTWEYIGGCAVCFNVPFAAEGTFSKLWFSTHSKLFHFAELFTVFNRLILKNQGTPHFSQVARDVIRIRVVNRPLAIALLVAVSHSMSGFHECMNHIIGPWIYSAIFYFNVKSAVLRILVWYCDCAHCDCVTVFIIYVNVRPALVHFWVLDFFFDWFDLGFDWQSNEKKVGN